MVLLFIRENGFYPLEFDMLPKGKTLEQFAIDNAECNPGTVRVETVTGRVLWEATQ